MTAQLDNHIEPLTPREEDVIRLVAYGNSNKEIGQGLGLSPRTVMVHISHIKAKLGIYSRVGLAVWFVHKHGWPTVESFKK